MNIDDSPMQQWKQIIPTYQSKLQEIERILIDSHPIASSISLRGLMSFLTHINSNFTYYNNDIKTISTLSGLSVGFVSLMQFIWFQLQ